MSAVSRRGRLQDAGFVACGPLLSGAEVAGLRATLERWLPPSEAPHSDHGLLRHDLASQLPAFGALLSDGRLGAAAAALLDLDAVTFFQDNLVWKTPGTRGAVQWHQDYAYWPLDRPAGVTLWLALDDADARNGALEYLPGSHHMGERQATDFVAGSRQPLHPHLPAFDADAHAHAAVTAPTPAGHLLAHHPLTWHRSPPNPSSRHRRAWSLTFVAPDVRWDPSHAPHPATLRLRPERGAPLGPPDHPRFGRG